MGYWYKDTTGNWVWIDGTTGQAGDPPANAPPPPAGNAAQGAQIGATSTGGGTAATMSTINAGGGGGGQGQQTPGPLGTGQFFYQGYPINDQAITGNPSQGAAANYGLNQVWDQLGALGQSAPLNAASAIQGAQAKAAQGGAAPQGQAVIGGPAQYGSVTGSASLAAPISAGGPAVAATGGVDQSGYQGWAGQQQGLANQLALQASGGGVSPADLQLQQGQQAALANQLAALGTARGSGGNAALAARSAADQAASGNANLGQQLGLQRAQETLGAQGALGGLLGTAAGQSQTMPLAQAQLAQQANLANAQFAQGQSQFNAGNAQQTALANAGAQNQFGLQGLAYQNQAMQGNAQLAQQMGLANLGYQNQFGMQNLLNQQQYGMANLGNQQQANMANAGFAQQAALANQQMQLANSQNYYNQVMGALGAQTGIGQSNRAASLADQQLQVDQQLGGGQIDAQAFQAAAQANAGLASTLLGFGGAVGTGLVQGFGGGGGGGGGGQPVGGSDVNTNEPDNGGNTGPVGISTPIGNYNTNTPIFGGGSGQPQGQGMGGYPQQQGLMGGGAPGSAFAAGAPQVPANLGNQNSQQGLVGGSGQGLMDGGPPPPQAQGGMTNLATSDRSKKTDIRDGSDEIVERLKARRGDTRTSPHADAVRNVMRWYATSDQNLKDGIEGANPMLDSYLRQYHDFQQKDPDRIDVTGGLNFRLPSYARGGGGGGSGLGGQIGGKVGAAAGGLAGGALAGAATGAAAGSVVPVIGTAIGGIVGGLLGTAVGNAAGGSGGGAGSSVMTSPGSGMTVGQDVENISDEDTSAMASSDERKKSDAERDPKQLREMLEHLVPYTYRYKDPHAPGAAPGQQVGVMAQDLQRSKLGSSYVHDTGDTGLMVDYGPHMQGTQLAALAYLNQRADENERMIRDLAEGRSGA